MNNDKAFKKYYLRVNLDERGDYDADVVGFDENDEEFSAFIIDYETANELIQDGFLKYKPDEDIARLEKYLKETKIFDSDSELFASEEDLNDSLTKDYSFGGGVAVGGIVGAYLGYKLGRRLPQKEKVFETEKKIGRKIKETAKDLRSKKKPQTMAKGGKVEYEWVKGMVAGYKGHDTKKGANAMLKELKKDLPNARNWEIEEVPYSWGTDYRINYEYERKKMAKGGGVDELKVGSKIGFLREHNGRYEYAEVLSIDGDKVNLVVRHPKRSQWDNYFTETKERISKYIKTPSSDWKDGRKVMKIKYDKGGEIPSEREIVEYYGQDYDNVSHMRGYVDSLVQRYKEEHGFKEVWSRFKDRTRKDFGGDKYAEGGIIYDNLIEDISDNVLIATEDGKVYRTTNVVDNNMYKVIGQIDLENTKTHYLKKGTKVMVFANAFQSDKRKGVNRFKKKMSKGGNISYDLSDVI